MNRLSLGLGLIMLVCLSLSAQGIEGEKDLDKIRAWFVEIEESIDQLTKMELLDVDFFGNTDQEKQPIEGRKIYRLTTTSITKYYDGDELVKLNVHFEGDRETLVSQYYLKNGDIFFVDKLNTIYHKPKWDSQFQESKKSTKKNCFYFKNDSLVRWVDNDIKSVGTQNPLYSKNESTILNDLNIYLNLN